LFTYIYDGSFEGLLSCIFAIYSTRNQPEAIFEKHRSPLLLGDVIELDSNEDFAARVLNGINSRTNNKGAEIAYKMFLSELPQREMDIFYFIKTVIEYNNPSILENFANEYILKASQITKMIHREIHRMHAFVRFQKSREGIFYAAIEPDFNVLPLLGDHFERRYADQPWIIFDMQRHYGLYYDLTRTVFVTMDNPVFNIHSGDLNAEIVDEKEKIYQALWGNYFQSVNIQARKNLKLHLRHMPKRYWKYLIEKRV